MAEPSGVEVLQSEIEKSKDKLRGYNENIKKLTGRDPTRPGIRRLLSGDGTEREENEYSGRVARGRGRVFGLARLGVIEESGPPAKRRAIGGAFSRLGPVPIRRRDREDSPYEEELPNKLSVHSSVVSTSRESKNRKEILQEQTKDKEGMQRNRRMFGLLLGTLNKFKTESKTLQTKEVQRKKIEEKLEENAEKEKRKFKQETKLLIEEMHLEQSKISRLQQKMEMVQEHADCEVEVKKLKNFIVTKTKPRIFWRPQQMSVSLENKLKESKKFVDGMLQDNRDRLEKEIKELMEREVKREERIKMRLREDGLLEDDEGKVEEVGNKSDGNRETGRVVVEVKEEMDVARTAIDRLGRHFEEQDMGEDSEDTEDLRKKPRRTVVVEREDTSGSESSDEDNEEDREKEMETNKSDGQNKDQTGLDKEHEANKNDDHSTADEMEDDKGDKERDISYSGNPKPNKEIVKRKESVEDESSDSDVEEEHPREGKGDIDNHRNRADRNQDDNRKDRSQNDSRKDRKKNEKEDSVERDRDRRRKDKNESTVRDRDSRRKEKNDKPDSEDRDSRRKEKNDKPDTVDRDSRRKEKNDRLDSEDRDSRRKEKNDKPDSEDRDSRRKEKNDKPDSEDRDSRRKEKNDKPDSEDRDSRRKEKNDKLETTERDKDSRRKEKNDKLESAERDRDSRRKEKNDKLESTDRDKDSRRKDGDRKSSKHDSGDKGKSRRDRHEEKHDKDRRRDKYNEGKKHSSRHTKDKKRHSESEESDIEIKQEKEASQSKNKDIGQSESVRTTDREENTDSGRIQRKFKNVIAVEEEAEMEVD